VSHCWLLVCTFFTKMSRQEFINESQCKRIIDMIKNDYKAYIQEAVKQFLHSIKKMVYDPNIYMC